LQAFRSADALFRSATLYTGQQLHSKTCNIAGFQAAEKAQRKGFKKSSIKTSVIQVSHKKRPCETASEKKNEEARKTRHTSNQTHGKKGKKQTKKELKEVHKAPVKSKGI
jgi:hypothetical protein